MDIADKQNDNAADIDHSPAFLEKKDGRLCISVIIPIYNSEKELQRCVDSVITQSYPELEIIMVNDGSKDSSPQICDAYAQQDARIKVIHKENAGVSAARNSALDIATGDYISFVDSDDWLEKDMYKILVSYLEGTDTDIVRFNAFKGDGILNATHLRGDYDGERRMKEIVLPMMGSEKLYGAFLMGVPWTYLFRRSIIEDQKIRFNTNLRRSEDRLFSITAMLYSQRITFIEDALYHYETLSGSLSNRYDPIRWEQELFYMDKLQEEYGKVFSEKEKADADSRIRSDYVLRAIIAIDNVFFSANNNTLIFAYKRTKEILRDIHVRKSVRDLEMEKRGLKGKILFFCVKHNQPLLLTMFQSLLLLKSKM